MFPTLLALALSQSQAATWQVDPSHTHVGFAVSHMAVSTVRGEFGVASGTIEYDPKNVAATKITATVATASVDTREPKRDTHLQSADFFEVAKFPEMTFVSTSIKNVTPKGFDAVGNLTIHGVTKEVTLKVGALSPEVKDPWGNVKVGTTATATINRKDFGLLWNKVLEAGGLLVGEEVAITLDVELTKAG